MRTVTPPTRLVKADGTHVTVYVNREFDVVGTEEGHGGRMARDEARDAQWWFDPRTGSPVIRGRPPFI
jgi:hypothetical protein